MDDIQRVRVLADQDRDTPIDGCPGVLHVESVAYNSQVYFVLRMLTGDHPKLGCQNVPLTYFQARQAFEELGRALRPFSDEEELISLICCPAEEGDNWTDGELIPVK